MNAAHSRAAPGAWRMWGLGVAAYGVAVFNRSSLGVTGLLAQHRFGASAAELSTLAIVQLGVYAGMQIPVGLLLDRLGSRRLISIGAAVMALGQLALALAHTLPAAVAARMLVGGGDALTFLSVLRLVPTWFPAHRAPLVTQLTGLVGQLGQVAAAYPLVALLHQAGWTRSFLLVAVLGGLTAVSVAAALRDAPPGVRPARVRRSPGDIGRELAAAWREPGTRMGLWTHFTSQFSGTVFALLWGYPFLVSGEGVSPRTAGALLTLLVVMAMGVGPLLGRLVGGWPYRRSLLVLGIVGGSAAMWAVVLVWPGRAPAWLLVLLVAVLATNGPGSLVGFDFARTTNPAERLGSATGIVNVGGFVASLVTILAIGLVLDAQTSGGVAHYTLADFRVAFSVQYAVWLVGLAGVVRGRVLLRRRLAQQGVRLDPAHRAALRRARQLSRERRSSSR